MDWKTVVWVLAAIVVVTGFGMEAYKKNIRGDRAGKKEIILVACLLSLVLPGCFAIGLGFPGLPGSLPGYCIGVFLLQWFVDQKVVKRIWRILGLLGKTELKKRGVSEEQLKEIDQDE